VTDRYRYTAFGELQEGESAGATPNNHLYAGEQYDPGLGWYALRARYMDPRNGRFASMDEWRGDPFAPMSLHKYLYAHAMPTNGTDPSGHSLVMLGPTTLIHGIGRSISIQVARRAMRKVVNEVIAQVGKVREIARRCLRNQKNECWDVPVLVVGRDNDHMARHIWDAQIGNSNNLIPNGFFASWSGRPRDDGWYRWQFGCSRVDLYRANKNKIHDPECDEYPMQSMNRGGEAHHPMFVSLRFVPGSQNGSVGSLWRHLARSSKMDKDPSKSALIIAWEEIPFSAYVKD
jgi:RHS repeat-associated protein